MKRNIIFLDFDGVINGTTKTKHKVPNFIDGLINMIPKSKKNLPKYEGKYVYFKQPDKTAIRFLNKLIKKFECDIVVSSSWREILTVPMLNDVIKYAGIKGEVIDVIKIPKERKDPDEIFHFGDDRDKSIPINLHERVINNQNKLKNGVPTFRYNYISNWLDAHRNNIKNYVIFDDWELIRYDLDTNFIHITCMEGIRRHHYLRAKSILKKK
jgi:hypothetical protein